MSHNIRSIIDDLENFSNHHVEHREKLRDFGLMWPKRDMRHCYVNDAYDLSLNIELRRMDGKVCYFGAILNNRPEVGLDTDAINRHEFNLRAPGYSQYYVEESVLVGIVEVGKNPQTRRVDWVPSIVRLYTFDETFGCVTEGGDPATFFLKMGEASTDRELEDSFIGGRVLSAVLDCQNINQMVKGRAKVVNAVSADQRPSLKQVGAVSIDDEAVSATVVVSLFSDAIRASVTPRPEFGLQSLEMFLSPPEF